VALFLWVRHTEGIDLNLRFLEATLVERLELPGSANEWVQRQRARGDTKDLARARLFSNPSRGGLFPGRAGGHSKASFSSATLRSALGASGDFAIPIETKIWSVLLSQTLLAKERVDSPRAPKISTSGRLCPRYQVRGGPVSGNSCLAWLQYGAQIIWCACVFLCCAFIRTASY
jgi:hypothetical protein